LPKRKSNKYVVLFHNFLKDGPITIARLEEDNEGNYILFADEGKGVEGPPTNGNYVWYEAKDWPKLEKHLMYGPYIHHVAGIHGHHARILKEASKYLGKVKFDSVDPVIF
jgi:L-fucose isomerase-like protein